MLRVAAVFATYIKLMIIATIIIVVEAVSYVSSYVGVVCVWGNANKIMVYENDLLEHFPFRLAHIIQIGMNHFYWQIGISVQILLPFYVLFYQ